MSVETSSMFERVIQDHLALKERNARLDGKMPIEGYKEADPFENHPLFKTEEQARIEETMDGVDPDFSDETLEDIGLGIWPGQQQAQPQASQPGAATATSTYFLFSIRRRSIRDSEAYLTRKGYSSCLARRSQDRKEMVSQPGRAISIRIG